MCEITQHSLLLDAGTGTEPRNCITLFQQV